MTHLLKFVAVLICCLLAIGTEEAECAPAVRLKELARVQGAHDASLIGYGLVVGLAGSGDSPRNRATVQSLANTLSNFGVRVGDADLSSRNTAAVMVTATLASFAEQGDRIDVQVSSLGDARSLGGGTLLLTPMYGPDQQLYALAQGALAVGGYAIEAASSRSQKNYPTVGRIPRGAVIERSSSQGVASAANTISVVLNTPDYTTAQRVASSIRSADGRLSVDVAHPGKVRVGYPVGTDIMELVARIEVLQVTPDYSARVVVNERSGTVVAGGGVRIGQVTVAHGDLQIEVVTDFLVSQPTQVVRPGANVQTAVVPSSTIRVSEEETGVVEVGDGATVGDLVLALQRLRIGPRDVISILQAIREAGALHAELVIQ